VGFSIMWPMRGRQAIVFLLSVMNRAYNFTLVCPKLGLVAQLSSFNMAWLGDVSWFLKHVKIS